MEQVMIVLPVLLNKLLNDVEGARAAILALDFAEHAVDLQAEPMTARMRGACVEYAAAAREAITLGHAHDRLVRAFEATFEAGWATPGHSDVTHVLDSAVLFACQDMLIEAGAMNKVARRKLTCQYIAREAQSAVGRRSAERTETGADRRTGPAARWEESRWQLHHVIATEPNPHA
jgi:AcrR family transcriptional regulator